MEKVVLGGLIMFYLQYTSVFLSKKNSARSKCHTFAGESGGRSDERHTSNHRRGGDDATFGASEKGINWGMPKPCNTN